MFSKMQLDRLNTLAFQLTLLYSIVFISTSFLAFYAFYILSSAYIYARADGEMQEDAREYADLLATQGLAAVKHEIAEESAEEDTQVFFVQLLTPDGDVLASTDTATWPSLKEAPWHPPAMQAQDKPYLENLAFPEKSFDVRVMTALLDSNHVLQIGTVLTYESRMMRLLKRVFGATMLIVVGCAGFIGWVMSKKALAGVEAVTRAAHEISKGHYENRVRVKNRQNEIQTLAKTFNFMADQVQSVFHEMQEMSDSIAHDMKSPITRLRGTAEVTFTRGKHIQEFRQMAAATIEECDYLLDMIDTMLDISEVEAGVYQLAGEDIDLVDLIRDICDLFEPAASHKGIRLQVETPGVLRFYGDRMKLKRMLGNLLDNAIKYAPKGGSIAVALKGNDQSGGILTIADSGMGIAPEDLPHIFKRFFRCDQSRAYGGSGLGLSLVAAIVKAHHGTIQVQSSLGTGSTFIVTLPARTTGA